MNASATPLIAIDLDPESLTTARAHVARELDREWPKRARERGAHLVAGALVRGTLSGEDVRANVEEAGATHKVRMALPLYEGSVSFAECGCALSSSKAAAAGCAHLWATYRALHDALAAHEEATAQTDDGESLFAALDAFVSEAETPGMDDDPDAAGESRLAWRVDADLTVTPYVQKRGANGAWGRGRRLAWDEFLSAPAHWQADADQRAAARVKPKRLASRDDDCDVDVFGLLQDLADHPLVAWAETPEIPLTITTGKIGLAVRTAADGEEGIVVASHINGAMPERQWIFAGRGYVTRAGTPSQLFLAPCNQATTDFLARLAQTSRPLPMDQKERLLSYLVRLEQHLAVAVTDALVPAVPEAANAMPHMRLTPLQPTGLRVEMLVRPSPTGGYFPLGAGPETVLDVTDPKRPRNVLRDLAGEAERGLALVTRLGLDAHRCHNGHAWFLRRDDEALDFVTALSAAAVHGDVAVEWPKFAQRAYELAEPLEAQSFRLSIGEGRDWFDVEGKVDVDGQAVDLKELIQAIKQKLRYVRLKNGKWAHVTQLFEKRLAKLAGMLEETEDGLAVSPAAVPEFAAWDPERENAEVSAANDAWYATFRRYRDARARRYALPEGFRATLRPYQQEGYEWMCRLADWGMGACLADDMGLGKTVQTLATLSYLAPRGPSLVIAPTSVSPNWVKEARRFAPGLRPIMYRDTDREAATAGFGPGDVVICSYGLAQRDGDKLRQVPWNAMVLDEAQAIKNFHTKTAQSIHQIPARWRLALSGTPIENGLSELWSLFRVVSPGMLGTWDRFRHSYALPIERFGMDTARQRLERRIRPFLLRRMKEDYLHELPPKTEIEVPVELGEEERALYDAVRVSAVRSLAEKAARAAEKGEEADQRLAVLAALTKLRQIACHPRLFDPDWGGSSAKLQAFVETCQALRANGHRALVFSQFTSHLAILGEALAAMGATFLSLDGSTPQARRAALVEAFQGGEGDFFLISVKAGGTGLTLTAADYVLHMDPWWNPAVEDQATDRAHRIGQTKPLTVYRFVTAGTVEEKIMTLHASKRDLAEKLFAADGHASALSVTQLMDLMKDGPKREPDAPLWAKTAASPAARDLGTGA